MLPPGYPFEWHENCPFPELDTVGNEGTSRYPAALADLRPSADYAALETTICTYRNIVEDVGVTQDGAGTDGTARAKCRRDNLCVVAHMRRGTYKCIVSNLASTASGSEALERKLSHACSGTNRERMTELSLGTYLLPRK